MRTCCKGYCSWPRPLKVKPFIYVPNVRHLFWGAEAMWHHSNAKIKHSFVLWLYHLMTRIYPSQNTPPFNWDYPWFNRDLHSFCTMVWFWSLKLSALFLMTFHQLQHHIGPHPQQSLEAVPMVFIIRAFLARSSGLKLNQSPTAAAWKNIKYCPVFPGFACSLTGFSWELTYPCLVATRY